MSQTLQESFAENVKTLRSKRKMSQEELGRKADLSTSYVSMLERGLRSPALDTVEAVAAALGVPPKSLLQ